MVLWVSTVTDKGTEKEIKGFIFLLAQQERGKPVVTPSVISLGGDCACWGVLCSGSAGGSAVLWGSPSSLPPSFGFRNTPGVAVWPSVPRGHQVLSHPSYSLCREGKGPPQGSNGLLQLDPVRRHLPPGPLCTSDPEWGIPENPFTPSCTGNGLGCVCPCPLTRNLLGAPHISPQLSGEENSSLLC